MARDTAFGDLVEGTTYGNYAIAGQEYQRDLLQIDKRTKTSILWFNIYVLKQYFGVWGDAKAGKIWISKKYDECRQTFCLSRPDVAGGMTLALPRDRRIQSLITNYKNGLVYFESEQIRATTAPAIARLAH